MEYGNRAADPLDALTGASPVSDPQKFDKYDYLKDYERQRAAKRKAEKQKKMMRELGTTGDSLDSRTAATSRE